MTAAPFDPDGNPSNLRTCTVEGCERPFYARSRCHRCYQRALLGVTVPPLTTEPTVKAMTYHFGGRFV